MSYFNNAKFDVHEWRDTNVAAGFGGHRKVVGVVRLSQAVGNLADLSVSPEPGLELSIDEPNSSSWRLVVSGMDALRLQELGRLEGLIVVVTGMRMLNGFYRPVVPSDISRFKISEAQIAIWADPSIQLTLVPVKEK
jgi:hypothetical protein